MKSPPRRQLQARSSLPFEHSYVRCTTFLPIQRRLMRIMAVPVNTVSKTYRYYAGWCLGRLGPSQGVQWHFSEAAMLGSNCAVPCNDQGLPDNEQEY